MLLEEGVCILFAKLLAFALIHFVFQGIHLYFILYSILYSSLIFRNEKERVHSGK